MLTGTLAAGGARVGFAFSDRFGGASAAPYDSRNVARHVGDEPAVVAGNRARTALDLGLEPEHVVYMDQVHSAVVTAVDSPCPDEVEACDGLVTSTSDLALAVMVADCVPVLLADPEAGVIAAVHAGRRGVESGIVPATVADLEARGARRERIQVRLGPAICGECYEVPPDLAREVLAVAPDSVATTPAGTPGLDLRRGLVGVLRDLGVTQAEICGPCTREDARFYSYRRASAEGTPTGRFAGYIWQIASNA